MFQRMLGQLWFERVPALTPFPVQVPVFLPRLPSPLRSLIRLLFQMQGPVILLVLVRVPILFAPAFQVSVPDLVLTSLQRGRLYSAARRLLPVQPCVPEPAQSGRQ